MDKELSLITLYQAVLEECKILIKNNVDEVTYEKMTKKVGQDLKKAINIYRDIFHDFPLGIIRTFGIEYLDEMEKNFEQNKSEEIKEHHIYTAYMYIFCFRYVNKLSELEEIVKFEYENYAHFSEILSRYFNPHILKENYENKAKQIMNGNFEKKNLKIFIEILKKRNLTQKKPEIIEKKKIRKTKNRKKNTDLNASLNLNKINIPNEEEKKDENDIKINIDNNQIPKESNTKIECEESGEKSDIRAIANDETKEEEKIENSKEIEHEIKLLNEQGNSSNSIEANLINENKNNNKDEIKLNNNNDDSNFNINEIKDEFEDNNNEIKEETISDDNIIKGGSKINKNEINEENIINLNKINNENNIDNIIEKENINDDNKKPNENIAKTTDNSKNNIDNENVTNITKEVPIINNKLNIKSDEEVSSKDNISYEKLVEIVFKLQEELKNTKAELTETKKDLSTKIEKLAYNQKLMYYMISMYHSRDISKSIYFYFAKHLKIKNNVKTFFDLKEIMLLLDKNGGKTTYLESEKEKLRKFFKSLFFVNKVGNKVMHNNISSKLQKEINEMKNEDDDLLSIIPTMSYNQLFETLGFYVENNTKNPQIQKAMQYVYENEYKNDPELGKIKDLENEAIIKLNDGSIKMLMTKEEIIDVRVIFSKIEDFEKDCELKTWG